MIYSGNQKYKLFVGNNAVKPAGGYKILYALYDQVFDGTVNSVIDTGITLWDGTYDNWVIEAEFTSPNTVKQETIFVCRPDRPPYNGIRIRRNAPNTNQLQATINAGRLTKVSGSLNFSTDNYGSHVLITSQERNILKWSKSGNIMDIECNGKNIKLNIYPTAQNLPLLIGCDYSGTTSTMRYFNGTIYKFVLKVMV